MNGGNISVAKSQTYSSNLTVESLTFANETGALNVKTRELQYNDTSNTHKFLVNNLYIMGMKVPSCERGYYWQEVPVNDTSYYVLACRTNNCSTYLQEEPCWQSGKCWDNNNCNCIQCS